MEDRLNELPKGWVWSTLGEISEVILGQSPPSSTYNEDGKGLPFYQGKLEFGYIYPSPQKWCSSPKKVAEKNDVLISVRAPVGPTNICPEKSCVGRGLAAIRPMGGIESLFVLYLIRAFENSIAGKGTGTTFNAITGSRLSGFEIPLSPLPEQHRIVAKIEELFTKLDAGIEALKKIKAQLKRYRQAVLKYAFEGKLTQEWREANKGKIEPASVLLERIKEQRKKEAKGKLKELPPIDTSELPELPEGWVWTKVREIGLIISGQTPKELNSCGGEGEIPFYKVNDMNRVGNERFMKESEICLMQNEVEKLKIHIQRTGTVIFPKRGGAIATNKKRILASPSAYDLNIMGVYPLIMPFMFFYYWISSLDLNTLSDGSNVPQINHKDIEPIPFPLPSLSEQEKIVEEIESRLSIADNMEKVAEQSLKQSDRLRQSILKKAFEGKLVPQDPTDLPAVELLKQIKEEREASVTSGKKKKNEKEFKK
jgi:type I restriction enzyme S subunit